MLTTLEKVDLLHHVHLFKKIPTESLLRVAAIAQVLQPEDHQSLFEAGGPSDAMFVLLKGSILLSSAGSKEHSLASLEAAGALTLLGEHTQSETASVRGPTTVLKIDREDLHEAMAEDINITRGIVRALVEMITDD
jgi:CRP-like cAMP-binding protein